MCSLYYSFLSFTFEVLLSVFGIAIVPYMAGDAFASSCDMTDVNVVPIGCGSMEHVFWRQYTVAFRQASLFVFIYKCILMQGAYLHIVHNSILENT